MGECRVGCTFLLQCGFQSRPGIRLCTEQLDRLFQVSERLLVVTLPHKIPFLRSRLPGHLQHLRLRGAHRGHALGRLRPSLISAQIPRRGEHLLLQLQELRSALFRLPVALFTLAVFLLKRPDSAEHQIALDPAHLPPAHQILRPEKPAQRVPRLQPLFLKRDGFAHTDFRAAFGVFAQHHLDRLPLAQLQGNAPALQVAVVPDFSDKIHLLDFGEAGVGLWQERTDLGRLVRQDLHLKLRGLPRAASLGVLEFEARRDRNGQFRKHPEKRRAFRGNGQLFQLAVLVAEPGGFDRLVQLKFPAHRGALWHGEFSRVFKSALCRFQSGRVLDQGVGT